MSAILGKLEGIGSLVAAKGKALIDGVFPPEKRSELLAKLQQFALRNPKLSVTDHPITLDLPQHAS